jgi:hypothetical protein
MSDKQFPTYTLRLPPDFWMPIDAWRRLQPDLPSRAEAVRRLVAAGLDVAEELRHVAFRREADGGLTTIPNLTTASSNLWPRLPKEPTPKEPKS